MTTATNTQTYQVSEESRTAFSVNCQGALHTINLRQDPMHQHGRIEKLFQFTSSITSWSMIILHDWIRVLSTSGKFQLDKDAGSYIPNCD